MFFHFLICPLSDCDLRTLIFSLKEYDLSPDITGSKKTNRNLVIGHSKGMRVHFCNPLHSSVPLSLPSTPAKWSWSYFSNHNYPNPVCFSLFFPSVQLESFSFRRGQESFSGPEVFSLVAAWRPFGGQLSWLQGHLPGAPFSSIIPKTGRAHRGLERKTGLSHLLTGLLCEVNPLVRVQISYTPFSISVHCTAAVMVIWVLLPGDKVSGQHLASGQWACTLVIHW